MEAKIILVGYDLDTIIPTIFDIGPFTATNMNGRTYRFNLNKTEHHVMGNHGDLLINVKFDGLILEPFREENLRNGVIDEEITATFIMTSRLNEVQYECYINEKDQAEKSIIPLNITRFELTEQRGDFIRDIAFPDAELLRYNREDAIYLGVRPKTMLEFIRYAKGTGRVSNAAIEALDTMREDLSMDEMNDALYESLRLNFKRFPDSDDLSDAIISWCSLITDVFNRTLEAVLSGEISERDLRRSRFNVIDGDGKK